MKINDIKEMKKKIQPLDLIIGIFIGIILTVLFVQFVQPNLKSNKTANSDNQAAQTGKTSIDDAPYLGDKAKAKVAIVEFSDFECPYCQQFYEQTYNQIVENYVNKNKIIFVYRNFPLPFHLPAAETDANAALCVKSLKGNEAFFKMADLIYKNTGLNGQGLSNDKLSEYASQAGVDEAKFKDCLTSDQFKDQIQKDTDAGTSAGVNGTPSFIVGKLKSNGDVEGELVVGALPFSDFQTVIDKYLK